MTKEKMRLRSLLLFALLGTGSLAMAQTSTTPSTVRLSSTIYSIGIEWPIAGDTNHNAAASVSYRIRGSSGWSAALPLVRVQNGTANTLAGSILFLIPGTTYEVTLALNDPDGGTGSQLLTATTRPLPVPPAGGRMLHVVPGTGGGDGTAANPFRGIPTAQAAALAGDTLLLHRGAYGGRIRFDKSGAAGRYVAWKAYGDGEVTLDGIDVAGSHIWLEGLTVRRQAYALNAAANPDDVVVTRCGFYENRRAIVMEEGGRNWYIADNTIVGDSPYTTESLDGEGIDLNVTGGHTVAHNSISSVADGISYPGGDVDIFGNDIFDTSDDGIEADYGGANLRMWGNRIHNAVHNGISFQPQGGAPWYIVRNQIVGNVEAAFKFRTTDRFVLLHNTIVNWGTAWPGDAMMCCNEDHLLRAIARNNLWVSLQGGQIWGFDAGVADWRTDLDYDGFDWGTSVTPFAYGGTALPDLPSLAAASGLERHGLRVSKDTCFQSLDVPGPPPAHVPAQVLTLRSGCSAVDAGAVLPNVNDGEFAGAAPDMGAFESGRPAPLFGPRTGPTARLSVLPATTAPGGSATLAWTTTGATGVTISPPVGSTALQGWAVVSPSATTTYTITATGPTGTASASATLRVSDLAPAAPSGLTARAVSSSGISLAWTDNSTNETGFTIEQASAGGSFAAVATVGANITAATATGLAPSTTYTYRVRAHNASGTSAYSATASATTLAVTGGSSPYTGTPVALPGVIQAENFDNGGAAVAYHDASSGNSGGAYRTTDVDIEATRDTGGGYNLGWVSAGEWLKYTVAVGSAGTYTLEIRVASPGAGGTFHIEANGVDRTGAITVPATGGWQTWVTVSRTITLSAGTQVLRLVMDAAGASTAVGNFNWIRVGGTPGSSPYTGTPVALPGTVQAENFDHGGASVAYHDASSGNSGGAYRATDVDIEATRDTGGGYNLGWVSAGEWLKYTVAVGTAGAYTLEVRVASPGAGGTFHVEANGVNLTGPMTVPATGGWQAWVTVGRAITLSAGTQVLRLVMDAAGSSTAVGNFNWIRVSGAPGSSPYTGTPVALPGTVQAENFDHGGAGVAYHDASSGNSGGAYRATDVDIEATHDTGGGYNLGWVSAGEWLKYTVAVGTAGAYTLEVRVASPGAGGTFHVEANGVDKTGAITVPATGGWQAWVTVSRTITLSAGTQVLRVVMDSVGPSTAVGNFNWLRVGTGTAATAGEVR